VRPIAGAWQTHWLEGSVALSAEVSLRLETRQVRVCKMAHNSSALAEQARALVGEMTLQEKAGLCSGENFWQLKSVERLGLPRINVSDGPHGLRKQSEDSDHLGLGNSVLATCFPSASALASSWDEALLGRVGEALGRECVAQDISVLLGPGINIKRHPLCGRNFEYFSEDPLLGGTLAAAVINGVQSQGVGSCLKHFAVYNQEANRMVVDAVVDERSLREIYLRGFEIAIERSRPWTMMTAYNRVNGDYCSDHRWLLKDVLRESWGYDGIVMSDWMATNNRVQGVGVGMDLEMPGTHGQNDRKIEAAVNAGELAMEDLDVVVERVVKLILKTRQRPEPGSPLNLDAHHQLAREAASRSAVLLKNDKHTLPLRPGQHIAVIGAFARHSRFQGSGSSKVNPTRVDQAFDCLQQWASEPSQQGTVLTYAPGYDPVGSAVDQQLIDEAVRAAQQADVAVVFAGLPQSFEAETADRPNLLLPEQHNRLVAAVAATDTPTAVVLSNGAPVVMNWIDGVDSVLEAYLTGQAAGSATTDLLVGRVNPSGKLAETFPLAREDVPADSHFPGEIRQVQYREGLYVGYRYFNGVDREVLFPFGHGLSYTRFQYSGAAINNAIPGQERLRARVIITNSGDLAGEEIVQVYVRCNSSRIHRPAQQLAGFSKIMLGAGQSAELEIALDERAFSYFDTNAKAWRKNPGAYNIEIGSSSRAVHAALPVVVPAGGATGSADPVVNQFFQSLAASQCKVPDEVFARMLGGNIPRAETSLPFTESSTIKELELTRLGRLVAGIFRKQALKMTKVDPQDAEMRSLIDAALSNIPLRSMALSSNGEFSFKALTVLVHVLNLKFGQALRVMLMNRET
jgi:beta-glucosidase